MPTRQSVDDESAWHLDKKVPIALILAILIQTAGIIWWASNADARLSAVESTARKTADKAERILEDTAASDRIASERITRLESTKEDVARRLDRIEAKVDDIISRLPAPQSPR